MNRKNGVSAIVATVLLIVITLAVAGVIMGWIIPMVNNSLSESTACQEALSDITVGQDYTCINSTEGNISVQVGKGPKASYTLAGLQAIISVGGNEYTEELNGTLPANNEMKVFTVSNESYKDADSIKIAPYVTVGNQEKLCDVVDEVILQSCAA
jgi:flagellin-like protein